jgi:DNA-binding beta-propeller fold protein YncE
MPVQSLAAIAYQAPTNVGGRYEGNRCIMNEDNIKPRIESGNPEVESLYGATIRSRRQPDEAEEQAPPSQLDGHTRLFECPSCAAPLRYNGGDAPTITCAFCGSSVIVPKEWRSVIEPEKARPIQPAVIPSPGTSEMGPQSAANHSSGILWTVFVVVAAVVLAAFRSGHLSSSSSFTPAHSATAPNPAAGFATRVQQLGNPGKDPGLFVNANHVAVDGAGNIYVAELQGRRVEVFDSAGRFVTQWKIDPGLKIESMAAAQNGNVYFQSNGLIWVVEGATGNKLEHLQDPRRIRFDQIAMTPNGDIVASKADFDIVSFDPEGKTLLGIRTVVPDTDSKANPPPHLLVATDASGNIYALSTAIGQDVYKFSPTGKFITRFPTAGHPHGLVGFAQDTAPEALAVDRQGRFYVCSFWSIQVFDSTGRYLDQIRKNDLNPTIAVGHGMAFDNNNNLLLASDDHVDKFAIAKP